ncbi:MAG: hypothetical protein SPG97_06615, partial [Bacilli bacterium]|nr:hypothetical protein [Bacilli bacterium]
YNTTKTINGTVCYYYTNSTLTNCLSNGYDITKPTKANYTFSGYYTGTNGSGTNYVNSSGTFINNVYKTTGNRTLYAKWTLNTKKMYVNDINGLYCMSKSGGGERIRLFSCGDVITVKANSEPNGWYYVPNLGCYSSGEYLSDTLTVNCSGGTPSGSGCGIPCSCNGEYLVFSSGCTADQKSYYMKKYYCRNGYVYNRDNNQIASGCA